LSRFGGDALRCQVDRLRFQAGESKKQHSREIAPEASGHRLDHKPVGQLRLNSAQENMADK
jgi:hypothetical protein